eukprot:109347_1
MGLNSGMTSPLYYTARWQINTVMMWYLLCCCCYNATNFWVLFAGASLGQVSITYIVFGYIAWILPHEAATTYTSYLIGPMSAGFISFYLSNRMVFVIVCVLCFVALIHSLVSIWSTQQKLESQQLTIGMMDGEEDRQFPICLNTTRTKDKCRYPRMNGLCCCL